MSIVNLTEVLEIVRTSKTEAEARRRIAEVDARYYRGMSVAAAVGVLVAAVAVALIVWLG